MRAISELFTATTLVVPCAESAAKEGVTPLSGNNMSIAPLSAPSGKGLRRKASLIFWLARNYSIIWREIRQADAVHTPIPGDIGTIGMVLAFLLRKPLFVRHCGNWFVQRTMAERFWRWFMESFAGGRNVMFATGGNSESPSRRNPNVTWIFSTSLREQELMAFGPRRDEDLCADRVRLIIACRQEKGKGTEKVIESLPLILKDFPQTTLDVVGDGGALADYKKVARTINVVERVTFHGKVNHSAVIRLLTQAELFCYPTNSEGFPKVVLEALACGLPVITTRVSVLPQLIGRGCGVLLEENSPEAMARAVKDVLSNRDVYIRMSARCVETARQYSLERWRDCIGERLRLAWGGLQNGNAS
jgi:glycosyltransferase involved in cell wall biosynthesis